MLVLLRRLLATCLNLLLLLQQVQGQLPAFSNGFYYQDISNGDAFFDRVHLHVESPQPAVSATRGSTVTLPCHFHYDPEPKTPRRTRVKWSWTPADGGSSARETEVMVAMGHRHRSYGDFRGRVRLRRSEPGDTSLVISELRLNDTGRYRCEVIDGLEDQSVMVELELQGVVFPYSSPRGRYHFNFSAARQACQDQDAALATFEQLFSAWQDGLDWCNAGWLADGTVQYPITEPREGCGGVALAPGVRSYGRPHRFLNRFDAFCFSASIKGSVYYLEESGGLNQTEAAKTCSLQGGQVATVGQLHAAWRLTGLDRCDAGWLADGSVRYPISRPRPRCGPPRPGVRSFGFPPASRRFGVYCYR